MSKKILSLTVFSVMGLFMMYAYSAVIVDKSYLETLQLKPTKNYIQELKSIILSNQDPYIRERGVFTLTNIAIRKRETDKIVDFLKNIAMDESNDNLRTSAYASIDLIRDYYPLKKVGNLVLSVSGDIRTGGKIELIAKVSSNVSIKEKAIIGITSLHKNIELLSKHGVHRVYLNANEPQELRYVLHLKKSGKYVIPVTFMMSFDRFDYEKIQKKILIVVNESNGEAVQVEDMRNMDIRTQQNRDNLSELHFTR